MGTLLVEALKGAQAEIAQQQGLFERFKRAGKLTGVLAQELRTAVSLAPFGVRAVRVRSSLPIAGSAGAALSPYGVVLHPAVAYGQQPRQQLDIYIPSSVAEQQGAPQTGLQQQQQQARSLLPVVFFVHGGIWVTGERWHFCSMATCLAQAGLVVVVPSYTLYPDGLAGQMAAEVLAAYKWTALHAARYGGDASNITVMGHSAGGHLGSLACLMLAQQKHQAAALQLTQQQHSQHLQLPALQRQQQQQQGQGRLLQQGELAGSELGIPQGQLMYEKQQQEQQDLQTARHLPAAQLQQRADLAAAEALHDHRQHHTSTQQEVHQPQEHQQQQQWQGEGLHWTSSLSVLQSVPVPTAFIGMSSVYDVGRHFEFESLRGVAGISTMARACGGAINFNAISPAVTLRQAAAAAAVVAEDANHKRHSHSTTDSNINSNSGASEAANRQVPAALPSQKPRHQPSQPQFPFSEGPMLLGEVIPYRSGLEGLRGGAARQLHISTGVPHHDTNQGKNKQQQQQQQLGLAESPSSSRSSGAAAAIVACPTTALLSCFCVAAAQYMPPCIVVSSLADHMVPWHEAAEMFLALRGCNIPAKHLIYDRPQHNDFVLAWLPVRMPPEAVAAAAVNRGSSSSIAALADDSIPAFARDLLSILTGAVTVHFETGSSAQTAAAVAAFERAAGMPELQQQPHAGVAESPQLGYPQPMSRL